RIRKRFGSCIDPSDFQREPVRTRGIWREPELTIGAVQEKLIGRAQKKDVAEIRETVAGGPGKVARDTVRKIEIDLYRRGGADIDVGLDAYCDRRHSGNRARPHGFWPQFLPGRSAQSHVG